MRAAAALAAAALLAGTVWAGPGDAGGDFLTTSGKLSDEDFYRLVSCRALPGGPCTVDPIRWAPEKADDIRVALLPAPLGYPQDLARRISVALDHAIAEINAAGAALRLRRVAGAAGADVTVRLSISRDGEPIEGTGVRGVDGQTIGAALVTVWWDEALRLTEAVIVMAADLPPPDVIPVVLEELTQAMGLMTDIRNPHYEGLSVFSEDSNAATRLGPQDRAALRRHYPPL
ncbi:DUF2927 domain-containing protein [Rubellimicrobium sp. CFH 75288]|uniref:DUF2927 domain-containing protein n=1 Tax=Rubellimicrobium sp. CFH 75288 TaxID=2697034 RepID=UPI0014127931|nr:DUF2927 domain-containing protein [Rubellimicrobium sp. CFH 75288]NAZ35596.1 DUF2927 domain-containing protein [Rubellimicrobium sp. CFH 75288]